MRLSAHDSNALLTFVGRKGNELTMKKLIAILTMSSMIFSSAAVFADEPADVNPIETEPAAQVEVVPADIIETATVIINGETLVTDVPARIINGRTMVPMRAIFEKLGANVEWIEADQLIIASKGYKLVTLKIGKNTLNMADISQSLNTSVELEVAPFLEGDRTLVPLRAVSEAFNATVEWDEATSTVTITTK